MLRGLSHVRRQVEHLPGSGRCKGVPPGAAGRSRVRPRADASVAGRGHGQAVRLWGRAGVPDGRDPALAGC